MPGVREKPDPDSSQSSKNRFLFRTISIGKKISQYRTGLNSEYNLKRGGAEFIAKEKSRKVSGWKINLEGSITLATPT